MQKLNQTNIFMLGCGAVAQSVLPILVKELNIKPSQITVMDIVDNSNKITDLVFGGLKYVLGHFTRDNYKDLLAKYLSSGDLFIDLSLNVDTYSLLKWCHENNVLFVNASIEIWNNIQNLQDSDPRDLTSYAKQMSIKDMISKWKYSGASALIDHGANPGLISHFVKFAIEEIAKKITLEQPNNSKYLELEDLLKAKNFARISQMLGIKTIHISERDSQVTSNPKRANEFVNTWSAKGLYEESISPAEVAWGTHEKFMPKGSLFCKNGPKDQICLRRQGMDTLVRSWVPSGEIIGMVMPHDETFGISNKLTVWQDDKIVYKPTVNYAYCPSDSAMSSLYELKMRQFELQSKLRIIDNVISGSDEFGCLLMGHEYNAWWVGSILDISQAQKLVPNQNATTVQVAISVVAAVKYVLNNPSKGVCFPDDLDHDEILDFVKPYLGRFVSMQTDWSPLYRKKTYFSYRPQIEISSEDKWQFTTFLVEACDEIIPCAE